MKSCQIDVFEGKNVRKYFVIVELTVEKYDWIKGEKMKNYVYMTDKDNVVTTIRHLNAGEMLNVDGEETKQTRTSLYTIKSRSKRSKKERPW